MPPSSWERSVLVRIVSFARFTVFLPVFVGNVVESAYGVDGRGLVSLYPCFGLRHPVRIVQPVVVVPYADGFRYRPPVRPLDGEASSVDVPLVAEVISVDAHERRPYPSCDFVFEFR